MSCNEVRIGGAGGQGILLAGVILAEGAIHEGKNAVQTQSYGPEARGGASKSEIIISTEEIDFPKVRDCNVFIALSQEAYDKYNYDIDEEDIVIIDSKVSLNIKKARRTYSVPITDTANSELKKPMVTNIVALGAIAAITDLVSKEKLEESIIDRVPKGTEDLNKTAFETGYILGRRAKIA